MFKYKNKYLSISSKNILPDFANGGELYIQGLFCFNTKVDGIGNKIYFEFDKRLDIMKVRYKQISFYIEKDKYTFIEKNSFQYMVFNLKNDIYDIIISIPKKADPCFNYF